MAIEWSPEFALGVERMEDTHREFIDRLNALDSATDEELVARFVELLDHTRGHFQQENDWMLDLHFPQRQAHLEEHEQVLKVMAAVLRRVEGGDLRLARMLIRELAGWQLRHILGMDTTLAQFMRAVRGGADRTDGSEA